MVLASGSPRRRELLAGAGWEFEVRPADIDETPRRAEAPIDYVRRLSIEKAAAVAQPGETVIAADTTVEVDGTILEKPVDDDDARRMLELLSGRSHHAHTGVTVVFGDDSQTIVVSTSVTFVDLTDDMIEWYLATGEADDKAGAYGIQGAAAGFVERIDGSVTNVIGLPLAETVAMLRSTTART
ncbi:Maf family protein [Ilumatobacter nonamiensis]|uniref:Maf family protein n=1 Tax=Ilumatobacter nonamiensis TaxID=467093 RepID=UPI00034D543B